MRFIKCVSVIAMILCLLCSCAKGEGDLKIRLSPSNETITNLVSVKYNENQLLSIIQFDGSMDDLNNEYPIECLRKSGNTYCASYLGKFSVAVIVFDEKGNKIFGDIYSALNPKSDFETIFIGDSLENVQKIDPKGDYAFLYTGRNDFPRQSIHFTNDGYRITITYDESDTVSNINSELV